ncbi:MAG TPA: TIGR03435 family protein [Bryobacteraceae bacterium]
MLVRVGAALILAAAALAQTPPAAPLSFEVASIKAAPPIDPMKMMQGKMHIGMKVDQARVDIGFASLTDLIRFAYKVKPYQVSGPEWMASQRFDVMAKMPDGATKDQVPEMIQSLLAERFKLIARKESKDYPVYALVVGKNGPKMKAADPVVAPPPPPPADGASTKMSMVVPTPDGDMRVTPNPDGRGATMSGGAFGQMKITVGEGGMMRLEFASVTMTSFAEILTRFSERPVIDMTELKGNYQLALDLSMEEMRNIMRAQAAQMGIAVPMGGGHMGGDGGKGGPADSASTPSGNSILGAVQQLGLKLEPRKTAIDTVVVDHLEKTPTDN